MENDTPIAKPTNTAIQRSEDRANADHIVRLEKNSVEETLVNELSERFGKERVEKYRQDYFRTLNNDNKFFVPDFPITLTMELVNRCNLTCVMCYTDNHKGTKFTLDKAQITKLFDEAKEHNLPALLLGSGSEGMLYKDIKEVVSLAHESGVIDLFLITNGTLLTEEMSEFIIDSGVSRLLISLDATTNETFTKVRGKPLLHQIEDNIHKFLEIREKKKALLPMLRISFCVQELNTHEQESFKEKWRDKADYIDFQVISDFGYVGELIENNDPGQTLKPNEFGEEKPFCHYPFQYLNVWSNGDITPCCVFYGKNLVMGNVDTDTLSEVWKGSKMKALREEFISGEINVTCSTCLSQRENVIADSSKAFVES
jgi:radical SAM protein with 4Fe4S-binding SPASM domain